MANSGGHELVSAGALDSGAHVNSGGFETVTIGGVASAATISGGTLEIQSGRSTGVGAVTFAAGGGGILQLDDSVHYNGLVAGFAQPDLLDLRDIPFTAGVTSATWSQSDPTGGSLFVTSGGMTASIKLLGQYTTDSFNVTTDNHGGTFVSDPPASAGSTTNHLPRAAGGSGGDPGVGSAVTQGNGGRVIGSAAGVDSLLSGAGSERFDFSTADLANAQTIDGSAG